MPMITGSTVTGRMCQFQSAAQRFSSKAVHEMFLTICLRNVKLNIIIGDRQRPEPIIGKAILTSVSTKAGQIQFLIVADKASVLRIATTCFI